MATYYTDISSSMVRAYFAGELQVPEGFRLVERFGPRTPYTERWVVEDLYAGEEYQGFLVSPVFRVESSEDQNAESVVTITEREIISQL